MINTKVGTKPWSDVRNESALKGDGKNNLTSDDLKQLGVNDIGELLNKTADPNWVDPSKKMRAVGNDKLDKDAFMKLMLAQMKNQDPTNPLKSHEMAAQLAQFSQLEQLQNVNTSLDELKRAQKPTETFQALNLIGKAVAGDSARITRLKGDTTHDLSFELPEDAKEVTLTIKNQNGELVRSFRLTDLKKGPNSWQWNGRDERDLVANVGEYSMVVEANNAQGKKLNAKTDFEGVITGVNYTAEGPVLIVGNQTVKMKDVKKVVDPMMLAAFQAAPGAGGPGQIPSQKDQISQNRPQGELKMMPPAAENQEKGADYGPGEMLPGVAMQSELLEKIEKETK